MKQLIADSGSTNTTWALLDGEQVTTLETVGANPLYVKPAQIKKIIQKEVLPFAGADVDKVWFYGAGVVSKESKADIKATLAEYFPGASVEVESDIVAACLALFGDKDGIACILGTGSNCTYWTGHGLGESVPAGGFILGDEGSGAYMGRKLLSDYIKNLLPDALAAEMDKQFHLTYPDIVSKVYREEAPSRFLASFSVFINEHRNHPYMKNLIVDSLEAFFLRNVDRFEPRQKRVGFVGSVAWAYQDFIYQICRNAGYRMGPLYASPIDGLVKYHGGK
ncbi:MAG: ATPase [Bacteroidales bacterium]|nr:ATPase [Bacteroidales bacterium]